MIKRAVQQRPDDGYIVDSLGWAYYRIGNYDEAVKHLERAIELKPEDPTINDHLGDAYWRIGRVLEAKFQWAHARDLKPDPDDLPKIEAKLKDGLPDETSSQAKAASREEERRRRLTLRPSLERIAGRTGSRQDQSDIARARPPRRRLSRARKPGGVRRSGRHARPCSRATMPTLDVSGPFAAASGPVADNLVLKARRRAARTRRGLEGRALRAREEYSGRRRSRRRLGRCGGGLAAAGARQRSCRSTIRGWRRRRARSAPMCRSASIRARASCAASAMNSRRRSICRRCRRCWSIRASRWRPATCSPNSPPHRPVRNRSAMCRARLMRLIDVSQRLRQRPHAGGDRLRAGDRRGARTRCVLCRARGWCACRARGRPVLRCSPSPARPRRRRGGLQAERKGLVDVARPRSVR